MSKRGWLGYWIDREVVDEVQREEIGKTIISAYVDLMVSCEEIARWLPGVTRANIYKFLNRAGVDTSKRKIPVVCSWCENDFEKTKKRFRAVRHHFCCRDCYDEWLHHIGMGYNQNSHGQRIARAVVGEYFTLEGGMVVHHEDKNTLNNMLRNLKVFANNGDHVRYHRDCGSDPIWDGSELCKGGKKRC